MKKEEYLNKLKVLFEQNLSEKDAEDALDYYKELFEYNDTNSLIERLGTPEEVLKKTISENQEIEFIPALHTIKRGFSSLLKLGKANKKNTIIMTLWIVFILLIILFELFIMSVTLIDIVLNIIITAYAVPLIFFEASIISLFILLILLTLRHLPYAIMPTLRRNKNEKA